MSAPSSIAVCVFAVSALTALLAAASPVLSSPAPGTPAEYTSLAPATLYVSMPGPPGVGEVRLWLLDNNFFVLRQMPGDKRKGGAAPCLTGRWRQVENGSILQLVNRHGLSVRFNIGGRGNLYGSMPTSPDMAPRSMVMKAIPYRMEPFTLMGLLEHRDGRLTLTDSASGLVFSPVTGEGADGGAQANPLFVEAEVSLGKGSLRIERLKSSTADIPPALRSKENFAGAVGGIVWLIPPTREASAISCAFRPLGAKRGALELAGPGVRLEATYKELPGQRLDISIRVEDARAAHTGEIEALLRVFNGPLSWSLENDALVLTTPDGLSLQMEKIHARRAR